MTARRIRCGARCGSSRRPGWRSRIPISPMPMPMCGSAIRRGSGWCGSRRSRPRRPAISRARWRSRAPRSMPAEFARAREALAPFIDAPTQRVAMLMAEIERTEHGDSGRARAWTLRAVRARHDPAWTADGYVSDRWRPVSPVTGPARRLSVADAGRRAAVRTRRAAIEASPFDEAMMAPRRVEPPRRSAAEPPSRRSRCRRRPRRIIHRPSRSPPAPRSSRPRSAAGRSPPPAEWSLFGPRRSRSFRRADPADILRIDEPHTTSRQ